MTHQTQIPHEALIVISTGAEAQFYRNAADDGNLKLSAVGSLEPKNLADDGPAGKRPPESSQRETDEATFSKQLARHLYSMAHAGEFDDLVLVADPDTLGELRPILHQEVTDKIVLELGKTLVNSTEDEIKRSLTSAS